MLPLKELTSYGLGTRGTATRSTTQRKPQEGGPTACATSAQPEPPVRPAVAGTVRAPDHVEHQFRGKWNTGSGACGTPIPAMWNTDSGQVERTQEVGSGTGDPVER